MSLTLEFIFVSPIYWASHSLFHVRWLSFFCFPLHNSSSFCGICSLLWMTFWGYITIMYLFLAQSFCISSWRITPWSHPLSLPIHSVFVSELHSFSMCIYLCKDVNPLCHIRSVWLFIMSTWCLEWNARISHCPSSVTGFSSSALIVPFSFLFLPFQKSNFHTSSCNSGKLEVTNAANKLNEQAFHPFFIHLFVFPDHRLLLRAGVRCSHCVSIASRKLPRNLVHLPFDTLSSDIDNFYAFVCDDAFAEK